MLLDIIKQFNWTDLFAVILLFRICYIGREKGLPVEVFKFLGTVLAIYISFHYYTALSDFLYSRAGIKFMPLEFLDFLCFVVLVLIGYSIFMVVRDLSSRFIKMEAVPTLNSWGGLVLGIARGLLLTSLIMFMLSVSTLGYLRESVAGSYLGKRIFNIAPATYTKIWDAAMSKFMSGEKFNKTVQEVQKNFAK